MRLIKLLAFSMFFSLCLALPQPFAFAKGDDPDMPPAFVDDEQPQAKSKAVKKLDLSDFLLKKESWDISQKELARVSGGSFAQGICKRELIYPCRKGEVSFPGAKRVVESVATFDGDKLQRVYALFDYTPDENELPRLSEGFGSLKNVLNELLKTDGKSFSFEFPNKRKIKIVEWKAPAAKIRLQCNDKLPGSYLSAVIESLDAPASSMTERFAAKRPLFEASQPQEDANARMKLLAVPMRRQLSGMSSCWAATLTRQLDALGSEIEQQELIEMVGGKEEKMLDEIANRLCVYHNEYQLFSTREAQDRAMRLLKKYNELAESSGEPKIKFSNDGVKISFADNFIDMKEPLLAKLPADEKDKAKYELFRKLATSCVDNGIPLGWTVVRWEPARGSSEPSTKHRRTIVGYDLDEDSVYFSDSWGLRFEKRKMHFRAAFAMTVWAELIAPNWIPRSTFPPEPPKKR